MVWDRSGVYDIITDGGPKVWVCAWKGSDRRVSGQGDLLAGITGTLLSWSSVSKGSDTKRLSPMKAAVIACVTVREASRLGFAKHARSLITSDILVCIGLASQLFQP
jgi:NAD(P)H-hydrate repair Nnr-like enzyme with NAD(P)H-hydrate dehydratase domain